MLINVLLIVSVEFGNMRFNRQELITLASNPATQFEKEGLLFITERQEGFFRRADGKHSI